MLCGCQGETPELIRMTDWASERRTAIVTGAARGIGAAIAKRLAGDGFAVAAVDADVAGSQHTAAAIGAVGGYAAAVGIDVADEDAVNRGVEDVVRELGAPTVLVNNAGIAHFDDIAQTKTAEWERVIAVDLRGPFFLARAVSPHMTEARWGRIINIASVSALGDPGRIAYASAKAGLIGFTKTLALELGPYGVTSNAIAPGFVVSDMTRTTARRLVRDFDEHQRIAAQSIPVGRVGQPEDVAHAAAFLASPAAGYVSGQVLYVAGGPVD